MGVAEKFYILLSMEDVLVVQNGKLDIICRRHNEDIVYNKDKYSNGSVGFFIYMFTVLYTSIHVIKNKVFYFSDSFLSEKSEGYIIIGNHIRVFFAKLFNSFLYER